MAGFWFALSVLWAGAQAIVALLVAHVAAPLLARWWAARQIAAFALADRLVDASGATQFIVMIPAHNEAPAIGALLESLRRVDYPAENWRICVVADNATDATATIARAHGYLVYERQSTAPSTKAQALDWLWDHLRSARQIPAGAYVVIVDADSRVAPNFARELERAVASGARAIQARREVKASGDNPMAALEAAAEETRQQLDGLARRAVGLSSYLFGSGMAFHRDTFERLLAVSRANTQINEDMLWQSWLATQNIKVLYWPRAVVSGHAVRNAAEFRRQRNRWIGGRVRGMLAEGWPLLRRGLRAGNLSQIDQGLHRCQPPRSLLAAALLICAGVGALAPTLSLLPWWGWLATLLVFGVQIGVGFAHLRLAPTAYLGLLLAPYYFAQIVLIAARTVIGHNANRWEPTRSSVAGRQ